MMSAPEASPDTQSDSSERRCGLVAIVGKPNVGKSTLLNALVGQKISITSRKAQTTRHRITGICNRGNSQFVLVDTPGFQTRHASALNRSLNKTVLGAIIDVDLVLFVVEAGQFRQADQRVLDLLSPGIPVFLIANKLDTVKQRARTRALAAENADPPFLCRTASPVGEKFQGYSSTCWQFVRNIFPSSLGGTRQMN